MDIRRFASLIKVGILDAMQFRLSLLVTAIGNLLYLLLVYYLWKAIFASSSSDIINGMTFTDTMIYLVFASALFNFMEMWVVWGMGRDIQSGQIIVDLLRPVPYKTWRFYSGLGECVVKFVTTLVPTGIVVFIVSKGAIKLGVNILFFVISSAMSMIINYYVNFMVGTICMYTESIWGVNIMKVVIVNLLSGATVPLAFFPDKIRSIIMFLPFHTIVNSPVQLLINNELNMAGRLQILGMQVFWLLALKALSAWFYNSSLKRITVNGG